MKGSMEGLLPMLALFIMAIVMATQSIPLAESLAQIVGSSTEDIERVVDTRAYTDFYFYNYVPLAGEYSVNNASYELGKDAGGKDWNNDWLEDNAFNDIYSTWVNESEQRLNNEIDGSEGSCIIADVEYSITPFGDTNANDTILWLFAGPAEGDETPLQAHCRTSSGDTKYLSEDDRYSTATNATNNRYTNLADETIQVFLDIKNELDDLSGETYTSSATSCDSSLDAEEDAESNVKPSLEDAVEDAISAGVGDAPERNYIEIVTRPDENYYVSDAGWDHISGGDVRRSGETTSTSDGNCGCCGEDCGEDDPPCTTRYSATAEASPDLVNIDWSIEDSEFKVIVDGEYRTLRFDVNGSNSYTHDW